MTNNNQWLSEESPASGTPSIQFSSFKIIQFLGSLVHCFARELLEQLYDIVPDVTTATTPLDNATMPFQCSATQWRQIKSQIRVAMFIMSFMSNYLCFRQFIYLNHSIVQTLHRIWSCILGTRRSLHFGRPYYKLLNIYWVFKRIRVVSNHDWVI